MSLNPLEKWHNIVRSRDARGIVDLLADEVVFYSPVVHTPQLGTTITTKYLTAALQVFANETFRYFREFVGENETVLEFETEIDGIVVNGVDMIRWNDDGKIIEFKVMIRPLKAINLIHQKMGEMLSSQPTLRDDNA
ncbi:nuclear transport factor 2 family protein [soil metagenome]